MKNLKEKCIVAGMVAGFIGLFLLAVWVRKYTGPFWYNMIFG